MMIKPREAMTREELLDENDRLRQQLAEHEETIEQLTDENADLRAELAQLKLEMEAIGAGGVSAVPITKPDHMELIADAAEVIDTLTSKLPDDHPLCVAARERAKRVVAGLYALAEGETV